MNEANRLAKLMIQRGVSPNAFIYNTLMDGFCLTGFDGARDLFVSMESMGCKHDVFSYNILINDILINGYCKNKEVEEALSLHQEMLCKGIKPDIVT